MEKDKKGERERKQEDDQVLKNLVITRVYAPDGNSDSKFFSRGIYHKGRFIMPGDP